MSERHYSAVVSLAHYSSDTRAFLLPELKVDHISQLCPHVESRVGTAPELVLRELLLESIT